MLLAGVFVLAASSTVVSCKDYEGDDYQQVKYDVSHLDASMQDRVTKLNARIDSLKDAFEKNKENSCDPDKCREQFNVLTGNINKQAGRIDSLATVTKGLDKDIKDQQKIINTLRDSLVILDKKITDGDKLLDEAIKTTNNTVEKYRTYFEKRVNSADSAAHAADSLARVALQAANDAQTAAGNAQTAADQAKADAKAASEKADSLYNVADKAIKTVDKKVDDMKEATVDMVATLLTQVIVQSTYSPAVGELALPVDVKANTLITYYGNNSGQAFQFPTRNSSYFYKASEAEAITAADLANAEGKVTIANGKLIDQDGAEGNAGHLYVTVNPNTVDATGVNFALVNSQGEKSAIKVGKAAKSDRVLSWGYTRAESNNFYDIPTTIDASNLDACKLNIERTGLRTAVKKFIKERNSDNTKASAKSLAKEMAQFVYENMNGVAPRLGLSTSYEVGYKDGAKRQLTNVSEMSIMGTAIKPLGFGAFNDIDNMQTVPGLERVESIISKFVNNIEVGKIKVDPGVDKIDRMSEVGLLTRNGQDYFITVKYDVNGVEQETKVKINDQIDDLLKIVNDTLTHANNSAVEKFNQSIDALNSIIEEMRGGYEVDLSDTKANLITKADNYLNRLNARFTYWFNRVTGAALQPCMLYDGADGYAHRLISGAGGVRVKGTSINLVPTTYTYELLAPAYKKFITVTNHKMSGTNLNKVINGDVRNVTITGLKSGETYNILYEAVDYNGKVAARQYKLVVE